MVATTRRVGKRTRHRRRSASVLEQLVAGCSAERVSVQFVDGRLLEGALLFNPIKRSGKLINVEQEFSLDFDPFEVREIRVIQSRSLTTDAEGSIPVQSKDNSSYAEDVLDSDDD